MDTFNKFNVTNTSSESDEKNKKKNDDESKNKTDIKNIIFQVIGGVIISLIIYWLSLFALNRDKLVITNKYSDLHKPTSFPIVNGYIDCVSGTNMVYNTFNNQSTNYINIPRSINRKGGAQFSYSFWLYLEDISPENIRNKIILCRGDVTEYPYRILEKSSNKIIETGKSNIVKCPQIMFGSNYKELIVEFNTVDKFNEKMVIVNNVSDTDSTIRRNLLSLTPNYWVLYTFVFEDNIQINDFENGISVRFYVNDTLYQIHKVRSTLKQNNGDITVLPDATKTGIKSGRICDVYYHNYALDDVKIKDIYTKGPTKSVYSRNNDFGKPLYLAASNRIDQTNL
jgi:hypothetical protein